MPVERFDIRLGPRSLPLLRLWGVKPGLAYAEIGEPPAGELQARFGRVRFATPLTRRSPTRWCRTCSISATTPPVPSSTPAASTTRRSAERGPVHLGQGHRRAAVAPRWRRVLRGSRARRGAHRLPRPGSMVALPRPGALHRRGQPRRVRGRAPTARHSRRRRETEPLGLVQQRRAAELPPGSAPGVRDRST